MASYDVHNSFKVNTPYVLSTLVKSDGYEIATEDLEVTMEKKRTRGGYQQEFSL